MTQRLDVETALRAAAPHELVGALRDALTTAYGATSVRLFLTDYGGTLLRSCDSSGRGEDSLPVSGSAEGRALGSQEPREQQVPRGDETDHHLPVTVRGDRIGILTVRLPGDRCAPEVLDELRYVADLLGREILVAERDTDVYQRARRVSRLTLAAEMQWQLLPARAYTEESFALGAQLEPAYAVHGDSFDWTADADALMLTVTNGMGEGIEASLLTHLAVNALRNARRAGIGLADQAALADQAVYDHYRGASYVSTLLLRIDRATGRVQTIDAGSPQLWRMREKSIERVPLEAQMPLGMFEESHYTPQEFTLAPGDRLIFVSDGVYETLSPLGERYAERALARSIHATSLLPAAMVPRAVLRDVAEYRNAESLDDALVLCLDWFGDDH
ncbi:serine/threonine-protein phosphatase [Streptomyces caniferus]|uniref:Phosphatase n=1 Tax=Streptomyces caniferus TaxID=285557 RepID=A0A640RYB4_9ACTN|nr:PP2C family protein-serine/threonine phosphatase [Streptomyces caniferus]GFE04203.1 phosphatase [Streptomyces caniferus]